MTAPGLVLTGKCFGRNPEGRPYTLDDGRTGVSHKVRVGLGGGSYVDVKVRDDAALLALIPTKEQAGADGVDVSWDVAVSYGKLTFVGVHSEGARALRSAAGS